MKKFSFFVAAAMIAIMLLSAAAPVFAAPDVVTIGFLGPITGSCSVEGSAARNAFLMAIDDANASGEYPYKIEVIVIDDQSDPTVGAAGAQKIIADPTVVVATGHWNSGVAAATTPIFVENEIPFLIWGAIRQDLVSEKTYPWVTRSAPTDVQENKPLAVAVVDEMGYNKIFMVSTTDSYGSGNTGAFKKELESRGIEPIGLEEVQSETVDFNAIVTKIMNSDAEAVYWGGTNTEGVYLKEQLYNAGADVLFFGISGIKTDDFLIIGPDAAEGTFAVQPGVRLDGTEAGRKFVEEYNSKGFDVGINSYTPYAYEAATILLQALKACGDEPTPEKMVEAVAKGTFHGVMGETTFDEIGQTTLVAVNLMVIQDGKWVYYSDSEYASGVRKFGGKE